VSLSSTPPFLEVPRLTSTWDAPQLTRSDTGSGSTTPSRVDAPEVAISSLTPLLSLPPPPVAPPTVTPAPARVLIVSQLLRPHLSTWPLIHFCLQPSRTTWTTLTIRAWTTSPPARSPVSGPSSPLTAESTCKPLYHSQYLLMAQTFNGAFPQFCVHNIPNILNTGAITRVPFHSFLLHKCYCLAFFGVGCILLCMLVRSFGIYRRHSLPASCMVLFIHIYHNKRFR